MGAWGTGLYQDDTTCDIKDTYVNLLKVGYTNIDATNYLIEHNTDTLSDEEEAPLFWFALADTQHKYGRLLPEVKDEALKYIDLGTDLERWKDTKKQYYKRKDVLDKLKEKLNSPQPKERKVTKLKMNRAIFKVGDIILCKLNDKSLIDSQLYNKYSLIKVIGIARWNIGSLPRDKYYHEHEIIGVFDWDGDNVPDEKCINNLKLISINDKIVKHTLMLNESDIDDNMLLLYNDSKNIPQNIDGSNSLIINYSDIPTSITDLFKRKHMYDMLEPDLPSELVEKNIINLAENTDYANACFALIEGKKYKENAAKVLEKRGYPFIDDSLNYIINWAISRFNESDGKIIIKILKTVPKNILTERIEKRIANIISYYNKDDYLDRFYVFIYNNMIDLEYFNNKKLFYILNEHSKLFQNSENID